VAMLYIAVIGYAIPRGFDFSDEGLYVGMANPFQSNEFGVLNYDLFFKLLHRLFKFELGIIELRIIRLFFYALAAFFLVRCSQLGQSYEKIWVYRIFLFLILCSGFAFLPMSLSYNSMTVVLGSIYLSLFVSAFLKKEQDLQLSLGMGVCIALLFYFKISVAFLLFINTFIFLLISRTAKFKNLSAFIFPLLATELMFWIMLKDCASIRIVEGIEILQHRDGYSFARLLKTNMVGLFWVLITFCLGFIFKVAGKIKSVVTKWVVYFLLLISVLGINKLTSITGEFVYSFMIIIVFLMGMLFQKNFFKIEAAQKRILILILFFYPFILHFGSNVYFLRMGIHYAFSWAIMLLLLVGNSENSSFLRIGLLVVLFPFLVDGVLLRPFEIEPIWKQKQTYTYRNNKMIFISNDQKEILDELNEIFLKINPKQEDVLPIYANPGIIYLLGYNLPVSPGIWDYEYLKAIYNEKIDVSIVLINDRDVFPSKQLAHYFKYDSPHLLKYGLCLYVRNPLIE
jgi:hypothetical protein